MDSIAEAIGELTRRTKDGFWQVTCPRRDTGTMVLDQSDEVDDLLVCCACQRVFASERRSAGERRIIEQVRSA